GLVGCSCARALEVGGFDAEPDDDYLWGLTLRIAAGADAGAVQHLPFVLTHRYAAGSDNSAPGRERAARALEGRLARVGKRAHVEPVGDTSFRVDYELPDE